MTSPSQPERIGQRYRVQRQLGKGGMASVYEVADLSLGTVVALKQLLPGSDAQKTRQAELLFEREFHTLAELSHPRVIAVYDYGIEDGAPYYTMELLDGGDLRERVPMPWPKACALLFEICSSLALLHSRRLIHRDVSPRNIRCTRDGAAKLIDFGAMVPMGHGRQAVGTPAFVAPEVLNRATLDARTDLFSLGATLYHALTGRMAYPARDFEHLVEVWSQKPPPPSSFVAEVPPALDALVMSLLSLDAASRPRTAYEVMQRLLAITGDDHDEPLSVQQAYLSTPMLVAREGALSRLDSAISKAVAGSGGCVVITGVAGVGRSRMLDACVLEAKTQNASVLRASADGTRQGTLGVAQVLAEQLLETDPETARASAHSTGVHQLLFVDKPSEHVPDRLKVLSELPREELHSALTRWILSIAEKKPLVIAVDDVQRVDEASAGVLVLLADKARTAKLLIAITNESDRGGTDSQALGILLSRCSAIELQPLHRTEEADLLRSVFGDVPNLGSISDWIHEISHGNPRMCMDLAQHLVDKQIAVYHGGNWTLPSGRTAIELPGSIEEVWQQRIALLSPPARALGRAHALALDDSLTHEHYLQLVPEHERRLAEQALSELISHQILVSSGDQYSLVHNGFRACLAAGLNAQERRQLHRDLARLYASDDMASAARGVHHLLAGGETAHALDRLMPILVAMQDKQVNLSDTANLSVKQVTQLLERALEAAVALGRDARSIAILRHWMVMLCVTNSELYYRHAPSWFAQLEHDSGLGLYRELTEIADPGARLGASFVQASERYAKTPEAERAYPPDEAIRLLVYYVATSILAGGNAFDAPLLASLPAVMEPYVALSPLIAVMRQNALATFAALCVCRFESGRKLWTRAVEQLSEPSVAAMQHVQSIRSAIAYGVGALEARVGLLASAAKWAEFLDHDPIQKINALNLRRVIRLQEGDWEGAERLRKQAEVQAVHASLQMVFTSLTVELTVAALADDLTALRQTADRIAKHAAGWRGWVPFDLLAQGYFHRSCGDFEAAREALERCIALVPPQTDDATRAIAAWPAATAAYVETLIALDRSAEAKLCGEQGLATCKALDLQLASHPIARALALAEAKLGQYAAAEARLEALALEQTTLGVSGVHLGATYEARARVAILAGDKRGIEMFGALTAQEYRHGHGSALGARYERLMDDARRAGVDVMPHLSQFASTMMPSTHSGLRGSPQAAVERVMRDAETRDERAQYALTLLCERLGARAGYLYLCDRFGLRFAASHAAGPATEEVLKLVRTELTRELGDNANATRVVSDESVVQTEIELSWTNGSGIVFRPVMLTCTIGGVARHAGVAALATNATRSRRKELNALMTALATSLIRAGDTAGIGDTD